VEALRQVRADKPTTEFHRRRRYGWQAWCKTCRREYDRDYHRRTRPIRLAQKKRYWADVIEWYRGLKTNKPCVDCGGIFHYAAMEWDHRPGTDKVAEVSTVVAKTRSKRRVLEEIAKCDLVCANCHAVRTHNRLMNGA
jgi:hypothetical protein